MSPKEINTLVATANMHDLESQIALCERYLTDYALIRSRHTLDGIYAQFIKLFWCQLKENFPNVINRNVSIKSASIDFQQAPDLAKMQSLIKCTLQTAKELSEDEYRRASIMTQRIFHALATQLPQILSHYFAEYSSLDISSKIIDQYTTNPSFNTFIETVKSIVSFGKSRTEVSRATTLLKELISRYDSVISSSKKDDFIKRISKIANSLGYRDELEFAAKKWEAEHGNTSSMLRLGTMFELGNGTHKNEDQAEYWYLQAIQAGEEQGRTLLDKLRERQNIRKENERQRELMQAQIRIQQRESEERIKLEKQQAEETARHNKQMEDYQERQALAEEQRTAIYKEANTPPEEKKIDVEFKYYILNSDGTIGKEEFTDEKTISNGEYMALLNGGPKAIANFIVSHFLYPSWEVADVSMKKIDF